MRSTQAGLAVLTVVVALSATAWAAVDGTDHDLRSRLGIDEVCLPCHAPHSGPGAEEGLVWNHQLTTATFMRHGEQVALTGSSKLCMSCHDGVTAVGNYGSITTNTNHITGGANIGTDLTDTHPVSVDYPSSGVYRPLADVESYLDDGKVECGSCHDAHGGLDGKFLRVTNTNSALCAVCHTFAAGTPVTP